MIVNQMRTMKTRIFSIQKWNNLIIYWKTWHWKLTKANVKSQKYRKSNLQDKKIVVKPSTTYKIFNKNSDFFQNLRIYPNPKLCRLIERRKTKHKLTKIHINQKNKQKIHYNSSAPKYIEPLFSHNSVQGKRRKFQAL